MQFSAIILIKDFKAVSKEFKIKYCIKSTKKCNIFVFKFLIKWNFIKIFELQLNTIIVNKTHFKFKKTLITKLSFKKKIVISDTYLIDKIKKVRKPSKNF